MLIKRTNGASSGSRMSRMLGGVSASTMDRRTFFRRSGVVAGGLAAASALGSGMVTKAKAATAVGASYIGLNYWFIPPVGSLEITKAQDLAPLIAFAVAAGASVGTIARINWLRQHAADTSARRRSDCVVRASAPRQPGRAILSGEVRES